MEIEKRIKNIEQALITLSKCIDIMESNERFTSRESLIKDILKNIDEKEKKRDLKKAQAKLSDLINDKDWPISQDIPDGKFNKLTKDLGDAMAKADLAFREMIRLGFSK